MPDVVVDVRRGRAAARTRERRRGSPSPPPASPSGSPRRRWRDRGRRAPGGRARRAPPVRAMPSTSGGRNSGERVSSARSPAIWWSGDPAGPNHPNRSTITSDCAVRVHTQLAFRPDRHDRQPRGRRGDVDVDRGRRRAARAARVGGEESGLPARRPRSGSRRSHRRRAAPTPGAGRATSTPPGPARTCGCRRRARGPARGNRRRGLPPAPYRSVRRNRSWRSRPRPVAALTSSRRQRWSERPRCRADFARA